MGFQSCVWGSGFENLDFPILGKLRKNSLFFQVFFFMCAGMCASSLLRTKASLFASALRASAKRKLWFNYWENVLKISIYLCYFPTQVNIIEPKLCVSLGGEAPQWISKTLVLNSLDTHMPAHTKKRLEKIRNFS